MIIRVILIVAVLYFIFSAFNKVQKAKPKKRKSLLIGYAVYSIIGLLLLAFFTGKLHWLGAVAAGAVGLLRVGLPTLMRLAPLAKFLGKNAPFGSPAFNTEFLVLRLDISSGVITGEIKSGPHAGKKLSELSNEDFTELEQHYAAKDKRSLYLLRIYRQKNSQHTNQGHSESSSQDFSAPTSNPSFDEALQILGIDKNTEKKDVDKAHKRLIQKLHPDRGGNDYLASRVNLARDIVLKHIKNK